MTAVKKKLESIGAQVVKVDAGRRLVFGFAVVCKVDGEEYTDLQDEHIPEEVMLDMAVDFFKASRLTDEMHDGGEDGVAVFGFPLTTAIADALEIKTSKTGLLLGMRPSVEVFKKFEDGTYTGFSIGGEGFVVEEELA